MHSLSELRDLLVSKQIQILDYNGWQLRVGDDTWVMIHDVLYLNGEKQNLKQKDLFDKYKRIKQNGNSSIKVGVRRGIGGGRFFRNENNN
jgi:hypothetical protein